MKCILAFICLSVCITTCAAKNTPYQVIINTNQQCYFDYDDEDFCDDESQKLYHQFPKKINFDTNKILVVPKKNQLGRAYVMDSHRHIVYPLGYDIQWQTIKYSKNSNQFCFSGFVTAYRNEHTGDFCFTFHGDGYFELQIVRAMD